MSKYIDNSLIFKYTLPTGVKTLYGGKPITYYSRNEGVTWVVYTEQIIFPETKLWISVPETLINGFTPFVSGNYDTLEIYRQSHIKTLPNNYLRVPASQYCSGTITNLIYSGLDDLENIGNDVFNERLNLTSLLSFTTKIHCTGGSIGTSLLRNTFDGCTNLTTAAIDIDFDECVSIGNYFMYQTFYKNEKLLIVTGNININCNIIGQSFMYQSMYGCIRLAYHNSNIMIRCIETIGNGFMDSTYYQNYLLTHNNDIYVKIGTTIGTRAFAQLYYQCSSLTRGYIELVLKGNVGNNTFYQTFYQCTKLYDTLIRIIDISGAIGDNVLYNTYTECTSLQDSHLEIYLNHMSIGNSFCREVYSSCTGLKNSNDIIIIYTFDNNIGTDTLYRAYYNCYNLTDVKENIYFEIDGGNIGNNFFAETYYGCLSLMNADASFEFKSGTIGNSVFYKTFNGCTSLLKFFGYMRLTSISTIGTNFLYQTFNSCLNFEKFEGYIWINNASVGTGFMYQTFRLLSKMAPLIFGNISNGNIITNQTFYEFAKYPDYEGQIIIDMTDEQNWVTYTQKYNNENIWLDPKHYRRIVNGNMNNTVESDIEHLMHYDTRRRNINNGFFSNGNEYY